MSKNRTKHNLPKIWFIAEGRRYEMLENISRFPKKKKTEYGNKVTLPMQYRYAII